MRFKKYTPEEVIAKNPCWSDKRVIAFFEGNKKVDVRFLIGRMDKIAWPHLVWALSVYPAFSKRDREETIKQIKLIASGKRIMATTRLAEYHGWRENDFYRVLLAVKYPPTREKVKQILREIVG